MNIYLTGCDSNTEWQLPWFIASLRRHTNLPLVIADFGISEAMKSRYPKFKFMPVKSSAKGWFKKPRAMLDASRIDAATAVCWLDTDCEVVGNIDSIFKRIKKHKLSMVEDKPWSKRRNSLGTWHNTGVVAFMSQPLTPALLRAWSEACLSNPVQGDQEVLHAMFHGDEIAKLSVIESLPSQYNVVRLDYIDGTAHRKPIVKHYTGAKGNDEIRAMIEGQRAALEPDAVVNPLV